MINKDNLLETKIPYLQQILLKEAQEFYQKRYARLRNPAVIDDKEIKLRFRNTMEDSLKSLSRQNLTEIEEKYFSTIRALFDLADSVSEGGYGEKVKAFFSDSDSSQEDKLLMLLYIDLCQKLSKEEFFSYLPRSFPKKKSCMRNCTP